MPSGWTLFLDRDGVINQHPTTHYVMDWEHFKFTEGGLTAIAQLTTYFNRIIVVTNQQGVGKKLMSQNQLEDIHNQMCQAISSFGGKIDYVAYCPDLATDPNNGRKPRPDMALEAQSRFPEINFERSVMIGDQATDIEFGRSLGMKTYHIYNTAKKTSFSHLTEPPKSFETLYDFMIYLINHHDEVLPPPLSTDT